MSAGNYQGEARTVQVKLGARSYEINFGDRRQQVPQHFRKWLELRFGDQEKPSAFVVTDANVAHIAADVESSLRHSNWRVGLFEIAPGEISKRLEVASAVWDQLIDFQADRRTIVIAVGGGVVGDLAGFAAATYARGIPFIQVPTTILAAVDSAVGGKVGINHPQAKNMIGAFHQPLGVFVDIESFNSLPDRDYRSGLAEVVKYGVILDADFFAFLEQNVDALNDRDPSVLTRAIARSCELKAYVVENDEYETTGLRAVLNYGHTFAHAFEALAGYGELLHGEAVAIGMICASQLAEKCGRIDEPITERQIELLKRLHLPVRLTKPESMSVDAVIDRMRLDKKTVGGQLRFVLPDRLGHVEVVKDVEEDWVRETLENHGLSASSG